MIGDTEHLAERSARIGILINLAAPALIVAVAVTLRESGLVPLPEGQSALTSLLFYVLGGVALMELAAGFVVRRTLFTPRRVASFRCDARLVEQWVVRSSTVVFALGASPIIYGVVVYFLGGDLRHLAFFGMVTLLAYRLLRPTADLIADALNLAENL
jgi:hypothetical protein